MNSDFRKLIFEIPTRGTSSLLINTEMAGICMWVELSLGKTTQKRVKKQRALWSGNSSKWMLELVTDYGTLNARNGNSMEVARNYTPFFSHFMRFSRQDSHHVTSVCVFPIRTHTTWQLDAHRRRRNCERGEAYLRFMEAEDEAHMKI